MTINREAAELMALRLTNAVDAAHTFAEALRLATVTLQETREVTKVEPGTVGTATVRGVEGVRVVRTDRSPENDLTGVWFTPLEEQIGSWLHPESEVTSFVPDPDTAALRAEVETLTTALAEANDARATMLTEVERLNGLIAMADRMGAQIAQERNDLHAEVERLRSAAAREKIRADAAEARLARVTEHSIACAVIERYPSFDTLSARGIAQAVLALAAADEQAAEVRPELITVPYDRHGDDVTCPDCPHSTSHHDPIACGDPSCDC